MNVLDDAIVERFRRIIVTHTGLVIPEHDTPLLHEKLQQRLSKVRTIQNQSWLQAEHYLAMLEEEHQISVEEWRALVLDLTTGESYFFRDDGQMRLLQETVIPELLRFRETEKQLRVWSAGCSSGEEPYSLAMLIQQLLPERSEWNILIKGTDINEQALHSARRGCYGHWAFRGVSHEVVANYFLRYRDEWQLQSSIRSMVDFDKLNLIKDLFPSTASNLCDLDLIVCRNVFIYFSSEAIAGIMGRFAASLRPGGYILTGHAEIQNPVSQMIESGVLPLQVRHFADSIIFQRPFVEKELSKDEPVLTNAMPSSCSLPSSKPNATAFLASSGRSGTFFRHQSESTQVVANIPARRRPPSSSSPPASSSSRQAWGLNSRLTSPKRSERLPSQVTVKDVQQLVEQGYYGRAIELAESLLEIAELAFDAELILAQTHANLGEIAKAEHHCRAALRQRPFATAPHFLLATIVHERGNIEQTKTLLNKVVYLDRSHVAAYLQLAAIHREEGAMERARQMNLAALDVLHGLPGSEHVPHYEEWTVTALVAQLEKALTA